MVEERVRQLLLEAGQDRLPASRVDLPAARRAGRRRLRWRRAGASVGSLAAVSALTAALATGTVGLPWAGSHGAGPAGPQRPPVKLRVLRVPRQFNMLVPYAAFGYLPSGYTTDGQTQTTDRTSVALAAAPRGHSLAQGPVLMLNVMAAGTCAIVTAPPHGNGAAAASPACALGPFLKQAPSVQGRPAFWVPNGLVWEYAPHAWAVLSANIRFFRPHGVGSHLPRSPAQLSKLSKAQRLLLLVPSEAPAQALLRVAGSVRYAQTTPVRFPFRLAGAGYADWQLADQVNYQTSGGLPLGGSLTAGPVGNPASGVGISVTAAGAGGNACGKVIPGQTQPVTVDGVPAVLRILSEPGKKFESLCIADIHGMSVYLAEDGLRSLTAFFGNLHLLGPDPARWTTHPLG